MLKLGDDESAFDASPDELNVYVCKLSSDSTQVLVNCCYAIGWHRNVRKEEEGATHGCCGTSFQATWSEKDKQKPRHRHQRWANNSLRCNCPATGLDACCSTLQHSHAFVLHGNETPHQNAACTTTASTSCFKHDNIQLCSEALNLQKAADVWKLYKVLKNIRCGATQDEPFHVGQTQQYCRAQFREWDPKITTFPGLYFFGALVGSCWHAIKSSLLRPQSKEVHIISLVKLWSTQSE